MGDDNDSDSPDEKVVSESEDEEDLHVSLTRLPTREHPCVAKLKPLTFTILPDEFFMIVYGARRTGKTHAISCLLDEIKDRFDFAYLFSKTAGLHKGDKKFSDFDMIVDDAKFDGYDEEILSRILERQRAVMLHNNAKENANDQKPNKTLIIFDDFVNDKRIRYSQLFTDLPIMGRHLDISVICLTQGYSAVAIGGLNKATRDNADLVMTFLPRNMNDTERISEWYLTKSKGENMWFVRSVGKMKHRALACDLTQPHLTEYEDFCYSCMAPAKIPKYELGKVQWKLLKEEKKRQKQAAMQEQIEHERRFYSTNPQEMEKYQRLGQATGIPNKRAKLSLFDTFNTQSGF